MEAIYQGVPGLAVSQESDATDYTLAADFTARLVKEVTSRGWPDGVVLSVNIPSDVASDIVGVKAVPMGGKYLRTAVYERQDSSRDGVSVYRARRQRLSGLTSAPTPMRMSRGSSPSLPCALTGRTKP